MDLENQSLDLKNFIQDLKERPDNAAREQLARWEIAGAGYGIHWPDLDEDLSTEGLLWGAAATAVSDT